MATEKKPDIAQVREQIDAIDNQIVTLLKERIGYAKDIGRLKNESNRAKWDPLRERQIHQLHLRRGQRLHGGARVLEPGNELRAGAVGRIRRAARERGARSPSSRGA